MKDIEFDINVKTIAQKVEETLYGKMFDDIVAELVKSILASKKFKSMLKAKLLKEINKQMPNKIKDFVEDIHIN